MGILWVWFFLLKFGWSGTERRRTERAEAGAAPILASRPDPEVAAAARLYRRSWLEIFLGKTWKGHQQQKRAQGFLPGSSFNLPENQGVPPRSYEKLTKFRKHLSKKR